MSNTIQIKRAGPSGSVIPSSLAVGELAYSENGNLLYIGTTGSTITTIGGGADHTLLAGLPASIAAKANIASPTFTGTVSGITAAMVGAPSGSGSSTGTNTGDQDLSGLALKTTTVNGHALSSNVTVTATDVGLGNVANQSVATMFTNPTFTGSVTVPTPTLATQAANKSYVDNAAAGLNVKTSVRALSITNITLSTGAANGSLFGGVTLATGDRILLVAQSTASQNGIYTVNASGAPTRSTDGVTGELLTGAVTFVSQGSGAGQQWILTTPGTITVDTTSQTWTQFGAGQVYTNGTGLLLSAGTFSIDSTVLTTSSTLDVTKFSSGIAAAHNGSLITNLNASNIASGTINASYLPSSVLLNTSTIDGGSF